jgi:hypothetical protein
LHWLELASLAAAVFGAAIAFAVQNFTKQRPPKGYTSIFAWDVIAMMEPMTLLGTSIGVRLNKMVRNDRECFGECLARV